MPVIKKYFDGVFSLGERYNFTMSRVADLLRLEENVPAGVVDDRLSDDEVVLRVKDLIEGLEAELIGFEKEVPQDLTTQKNIADLLMDVRCYIDSQKRE